MQNVLPHIDLEKITDLEIRSVVILVLNCYETAMKTIVDQSQKIQELKDEIAFLKGEQGMPDIKPTNKNKDISSEKYHPNPKKKHEKTSRENKINDKKIKIDRTVICTIDKNTLPPDAIRKGIEKTIVQNIIFKSDNVEYLRDVYYSPSQHKTYTAPLPYDYTGYIGSNLKTFIHIFHWDWDVTRRKLISGLASIGIDISHGMLNTILFEPAQIVILEKDNILKAGLAGEYTQMDATGAKFFGQRYTTQIIDSPDFTVFATLAKKSRLHILFALQGEPKDGLKYAYNAQTEKYLQHFKISLPDKDWLKNRFSDIAFVYEFDFLKIISKEHSTLYAKPNMFNKVCESFAFGYYFTQTDYPIIEFLVSDDAKEYKMIALNQMLCWIHDARYYNKLSPLSENHRTILNNFKDLYWSYYHLLQDYKRYPSVETATELDIKFNKLFVPATDYFDLNKEIERTKSNKIELLTVLKQPLLPLHNNASELKAHVVVKKRDISLHTMSELGTQVKDAMMSIIQTTKQLGVDTWKYISDLINKKNEYSLADLIYANQYNTS